MIAVAVKLSTSNKSPRDSFSSSDVHRKRQKIVMAVFVFGSEIKTDSCHFEARKRENYLYRVRHNQNADPLFITFSMSSRSCDVVCIAFMRQRRYDDNADTSTILYGHICLNSQALRNIGSRSMLAKRIRGLRRPSYRPDWRVVGHQ